MPRTASAGSVNKKLPQWTRQIETDTLLSRSRSAKIQTCCLPKLNRCKPLIDGRSATRKLGLWSTLLLRFCKAPGSATPGHAPHDEAQALSIVNSVFPDFERQIRGKRVVDFGCGSGYQVIAYARSGASSVVGVEIVEHLAILCAERAEEENLSSVVRIERQLSEPGAADVIISQNSFEHFTEPDAIMKQLKQALAPGGRIFITFGPPWFAPTGAHMGFFCPLPWVQLLFPESAVFEVRGLYRDDKPTSYLEAGVGKISVGRFERIVRDCGLKMTSCRYDCIKGLDFLQHIPVIRELAINRISCVLEPAS